MISSLQGFDPIKLLEQGLNSPDEQVQSLPPLLPNIERLNLHFRDRLEITKKIGSGGMGAVFQATDLASGEKRAIKVLFANLSEQPDFIDRFQREARSLTTLQHPGIVRIYENGWIGDDYAYLIMEFVPGITLAERLFNTPSHHEIIPLFPQLCEALSSAHQAGIIHRDLKPGNILITPENEVKIIDFGLAKVTSEEQSLLTLTQSNVSMGTPYYAAPEQIRAHHQADYTADIYSIGVILYEILTTRIPQGSWIKPSQIAEVDPRFDQITETALQTDPEDRYQSIDKLKDDLESVLNSKTATLTLQALPSAIRFGDIAWSIVALLMLNYTLSAMVLMRWDAYAEALPLTPFAGKSGILDGAYEMLHYFVPCFYFPMSLWLHYRWKQTRPFHLAERFPAPFGWLPKKRGLEYPIFASAFLVLFYSFPLWLISDFMGKLSKESVFGDKAKYQLYNTPSWEPTSWWVTSRSDKFISLGYHPGPALDGPEFHPIITPLIIFGFFGIIMLLKWIYFLKIAKSLIASVIKKVWPQREDRL